MPTSPKEITEQLLGTLGFTATVAEHKLGDDLMLDIKTEDAGRLIGRQGQTLADLQYLTNRIVFQQDQSAPKVMRAALDLGIDYMDCHLSAPGKWAAARALEKEIVKKNLCFMYYFYCRSFCSLSSGWNF